MNGHGLAAFAVFIALVGNVGVFIFTQRGIEENRKTNQALCAQRDDLDRQIVNTRTLLEETEGHLIFAIPRQLIVDGLKANQATRANLAILDCGAK